MARPLHLLQRPLRDLLRRLHVESAGSLLLHYCLDNWVGRTDARLHLNSYMRHSVAFIMLVLTHDKLPFGWLGCVAAF